MPLRKREIFSKRSSLPQPHPHCHLSVGVNFFFSGNQIGMFFVQVLFCYDMSKVPIDDVDVIKLWKFDKGVDARGAKC